MDLNREDFDKYMEEQRQWTEAVNRLSMPSSNSSTAGNMTISVNAGGVGVWIATTCCVVMLVILAIGGFWITNEMNRVDSQMRDRKEENLRMQSYLSAIFVNAPRLKPDDYEKKEQSK